MKESNALYVQEFKVWIKEQFARIKEIKTCIETSKKIAECNEQELELLLRRINLGIKDYNVWAENNDIETIPLLEG